MARAAQRPAMAIRTGTRASTSKPRTSPSDLRRRRRWFVSRRKLGGGDGARGFRFDAAPAYGAAAYGFFYGTEEDYVHELAIVEALQEHGDEQGPVFFLFKSEGKDAGQHVDQQEAEEKQHRALQVRGGGGREQRQPYDVILRESQSDYGTEKEQVDYWRD